MIRSLLLISVLCMLGACQSIPEPKKADNLILKPASFADLPAWQDDDVSQITPAFTKSCGVVLKSPPETAFGALPQAGTYSDWQRLCHAFLKLPRGGERSFFEQNFKPYAVYAGDDPYGLFTGYYEASLRGARKRGGAYIYPLHARPDDLVMVDLGQFRKELKGQRIAGRVKDGNLKPYEPRADIIEGKWPHADKVLVWVDDPVDAFFVQIQGSGVVQMAEGGIMRIGYAGQNGHPYFAIGKELIVRRALTKENVSMQSIRKWLHDNPAEAAAVMNKNPSYVFFRELGDEGAIGAQGVSLTPLRSLAVDRAQIPYGAPLWVDIEKPQAGEGKDLQRLMIAQDTGGAITGAVRGDVFWGYGAQAEQNAGIMKSKGRYWILLPIK